MSIFVKVCLFWLIGFKLYQMITKGNNSITSYSSAYDVDQSSGIDIKQLKMLNYHVIHK
jgi:hypothetical protein